MNPAQIEDAAWHFERRKGIGGSDVAAILGLSAWATPLEIYLQKIGEAAPSRETEAMHWGKRVEPIVRQEYADRTGRTVRVPKKAIVHPKYPFMRVNLDGETDCGRLYEGKIARTGEEWGEQGSDEVPQPYLLQCQHGMCVTGYEVADIAVLVGGSEYRQYEIPADRDIHEMLIEREAEFWGRVERREPPEPINSADALLRWGRISKSKSEIAGPVEEEAIRVLRRLAFERSKIDGQIEDQKLIVMARLGAAERLVHSRGGTLATWRTQRNSVGGQSRIFKLK